MDRSTLQLVPTAPRLALECMGGGEVVFFLHGVGGNRANWRAQLPAFGARFHAVAWDARGYGDSDDYEGDIGIGHFSHDLARALDFLGAPSAHLVGLSMGGFIAQDFCARYPARVKSLVLADTAVSLRVARGEDWTRQFVDARRRPILQGRPMAELARQNAGNLVAGGEDSAAHAAAVASLAALRPASYLKALEAVAAFDNPLEHAAVRVPVLVVVGAQDRLTPPEDSRELARRIPGARYVELAGAGHLSNMDDPAAFNGEVLAFLG